MPSQSFPTWSQKSLTSQGVLYRPLQDIEIYVEDENSEAFYTELLSRLLTPKYTVRKVIPLHGRKNVISACLSFNSQEPAMFIIDGDLAWVSNSQLPTHERLFIHPCYCVENYLFCENAAVELIVEESGKKTRSEAVAELNWRAFRYNIEKPLIELFCEFATAYILEPSLKTTSHKYSSICRKCKKKSPPEFDKERYLEIKSRVKGGITSKHSEAEYSEVREKIYTRVESLPDSLDAVSGKDFLIPSLRFKLMTLSVNSISTSSFVFRLARHCSLDKMLPLKWALENEIERCRN